MDDKAKVRAWLYEILAMVERADELDGSMTTDHDEVTLKVKFQ